MPNVTGSHLSRRLLKFSLIYERFGWQACFRNELCSETKVWLLRLCVENNVYSGCDLAPWGATARMESCTEVVGPQLRVTSLTQLVFVFWRLGLFLSGVYSFCSLWPRVCTTCCNYRSRCIYVQWTARRSHPWNHCCVQGSGLSVTTDSFLVYFCHLFLPAPATADQLSVT